VKKLLLLVLNTGLLSGILWAQSQDPVQTVSAARATRQPPTAMSFTPGTLIRTQLEKSIDAKKAKVGDQVLAKTLDDLQAVPPGLVPRGCQIIGHVVEVRAHEGDSPSVLRIEFDKMILKNGSDMPLPATIKAVGYVDQFDPSTNTDLGDRMGASTGVTQLPSSMPPSDSAGGGNPNMYAGQRMPTASTSSPGAKLPFNAIGTIGMSGVQLSTGSVQDSVLISKKHNVKLDGGMQMLLKTR